MRQKDLSDAIGLEKVMTIEEWVRQECFKAPPEHSVELAKSAWDYQQQAIDALSLEWAKQQARIEALEKAAIDAVQGYENYAESGFEEVLDPPMMALAALLQEPTK